MACTSPTIHGWSDNIKRLFTHRSNTPSNRSSKEAGRILRPAGMIWRSALAQSIFFDLALAVDAGKRFLPLHHLGLSGVILYDLPDPRYDGDTPNENSKRFTLSGVFGDPDDPQDLGMETDELLDRVHARLIYLPAYACTSFVVSFPFSPSRLCRTNHSTDMTRRRIYDADGASDERSDLQQ